MTFYAISVTCFLCLVAVFALNSICVAQHKSDWVFAVATESGGKIYINPSPVKQPGGIITIEYEEENKLLDSRANIHSKTIFIVDVRCSSKQVKLIGMRLYDAKGKLLTQNVYKDEPWESAPINTAKRAIVMKACDMFGK